MNSLKVLFTFVFFVCLLDRVKLLDNGLARTPPMGWMSWGYYMCGDNCLDNPQKCLDEELILSVADSFYNDGYQEAGYEYIVIDDCWSERERGSDGRLVPDKNRFPNGMKYIADYIHSKGLKFGMYTNVANITCMHFPGSRNHFGIDAMTFAEWGVDYIKVDGCFVGESFLNTAYIKLGHYLNKTERAIVYSCSWPYYIEYIHRKTPDYSKVAAHCNLWRNYHDVSTSWASVRIIMEHYKQEYSTLSKYHGPGGWNDPDMLIIGTDVLTEGQSRVQMSVYAMLSAPLLLSCDMTKISDYEKSLLQNMDLIAIGQDPLGIMAQPYELSYFITLWVKRHLPMKGDKYHSFSFALVNVYQSNFTVSFAPSNYGLESEGGYSVMDVFTGKYLRNVTLEDTMTVLVPFEDVILYSLYAL
ncbi:PREDICTED: alpha-N-acetylgalactosaminidase-like [Papilio xuthus]|uniref:Alpha-galactosidase n=1 Tax=Papilio xuthus TaxID=66420 RepID=A0AAJ6Z2G2_PAPXU|nr:PREDICTED: alpha-N-acetylgalactosaminidase-like [Papilio xuthus]